MAKSGWDDEEASRQNGELALRAYSSRLLGVDPALVLHGGGNTSMKTAEKTATGELEEVLWVKGSGRDLGLIDESGFAPVRLQRLRALAGLENLSDLEMANELRTSLLDAAAPEPSVEAILHAILPYKFVDHTHAEAFLAITNTPGGDDLVRELYADIAVILPYVMPGFELARLCAKQFEAEADDATIGIVLIRHGLVSFGHDARTSYERMLELVERAEAFLVGRGARSILRPLSHEAPGRLARPLAELRARISAAAGAPLVMTRRETAATLAFAARDDLSNLSQRGPVTPDHVIRTKRLPLVGRDVDAYVDSYRRYFAEHADESSTMLDPAPRIVLDRELGLCALGTTAQAAAIAGDIYERTIDVILAATAVEEYEPLPAADVFAVEYWSLEQAKLRRQVEPPPLSGEVAVVTGAASGIGRACVDALLLRGAAVVGLDVDAAVEQIDEAAFLGIRCDVTSDREVAAAIERAVRRFGGVDVLILNAGVFPPTRALADLDEAEWRRTMAVNVDAAAIMLRDAYHFLALAPRGGRVAVVASKNVAAPGPGAAAYSASKAALTQLARVAALEWARDGIRVNVVHPNAVFDTGLWTDEVLQERATSYGTTVEEYRRGTLLGVEVRSRDVAEVVAELCGPVFSRTTGAQIPVDGGNERVV